MNLPPLDLTILASYLLGVVAFGLLMGRRQRSAADFMLAGRRVPWWLALFSIVATETSTVTFLSIPGFAYGNDLRWLQLPLGFAAGRLLVVVLLLPGYFRGEIVTAYEVLHRRFGGATQQVASLLFIVTRTLADGLRLFLSAIVLQEIAGIPMSQAIVALGLATVLYTFMGGMKAVLWTDLIQFVVYLAGAGVAFAVLMGRIEGGVTGFLEIGSTAGKFHLWELGFDWRSPYLLWAGLIGGAVLSVASHGVDQMMVQRYLCTGSRRKAGVALGLSGVVVFLQFAFFLLIGVALFSYHLQDVLGPLTEPARPWLEEGHRLPLLLSRLRELMGELSAVALEEGRSLTQVLSDQVAAARASTHGYDTPDRVFASFIVNVMPTGLRGVVLGAVFAAAMSTLSSSLNSSATALWNDLYRPRLRPGAGEREKLRTLRLFTVLFGAAQILVGISGRGLETSVVNAVLAIAAFTTGLILGVFLLGLVSRAVSQRDALVGLVGGLALMTWVLFGTELAWPWYGVVGSAAVVALGLLAGVVLPGSPAKGHLIAGKGEVGHE